jgi:TRAP-type C4-dicarboxylate transport system substrate-binding protein
MIPDDFKILTPKECEIWQQLTPEQRELIEEEIAEAIARFRRSQFKLVRGGRREAKINKRDLR